MRTLSLFFLACLTAYSFSVSAHGDLHQRITEVTAAIERNPDDIGLLAKRGQLLLEHEEYDRALQDFCSAYQMGLDEKRLDYWQAEAYLGLGMPGAGEVHITDYLAANPGNVRGLRLYGKLAQQDKNYPLAEQQYIQVIKLASERLPYNYMELVEVLRAQDKDSLAVVWLQKGIDDLGPIVTFEIVLQQLHEKLGQHDKTIALLKKRLGQMQRKESLYYEIAKAYLMVGDHQHFDLYIDSAKQAWELLPKHIRETPAMQTLHDSLYTGNVYR